MPTLPLQTDPNAPVVTSWSVNNGGTYTYASKVSFSLDATESPSGIAAYALSNDGGAWTTYGEGGCTVGQVAACQSTLAATGTWTLPPGPGAKTVYARVESAAGVWSAAQATSVYVNQDQATPVVNVTLDGGAASTSSTSATAAVSVSDPAAKAASATWESRVSLDGGQTWSAWTPEGTSGAWTMSVTLPGGASGQRQVLVQAENSDHNLGQGGASIYFAAPGAGSGAGGGTPVIPKACTWPVGGTSVAAECVAQPAVTVPLSPPASAVEMRASLNGVDWGPWEPVASSLPTNLGAAPGLKSLWVEFRDAQGNVTVDPSDDPGYFVLDPGPPTVRASWVGGAAATDSSGNATLQLQASDPVGVIGMSLSVSENGSYLYQGPFKVSLPLTLNGSGFQQVQVVVVDVGGNAASAAEGIYVE
jgi:hypothetical protein